jgi:chromosome segregation ATPase
MSRLPLFFLFAVLSGLLLWNYRLVRENKRLAGLLREARRIPRTEKKTAPAKADPELAKLQSQIKDEQENVDALAQRLRETQGLVAAADDVGAMKQDMLAQKAVVDELNRQLGALGAASSVRLTGSAAKQLRQKLSQQIAAEQTQLQALKDRKTRLESDSSAPARRELPGVKAQLQAEQKLLRDLKEQRNALGQWSGASAPITVTQSPEQTQIRSEIQEQLATETDTYQRLKSRYDQAARETHADRSETARLETELNKHQNRLNDLKNRFTQTQRNRQTAASPERPEPVESGEPPEESP